MREGRRQGGSTQPLQGKAGGKAEVPDREGGGEGGEGGGGGKGGGGHGSARR